jgi:hypothetical protein
MVYIPYPRRDLDNHADLSTWRNNNNKREGDWTILKIFLAAQPRLIDGIHPLPKCWYSELPQGDNVAIDVEHFRPKNQASPLNAKQKKIIEKETGVQFRQLNTEGAYSWLEFDHRNYRLVTATPNRGGAKGVYFPLVENTGRLNTGDFPWQTTEFPYLLDPANPHDASLLLVLADGRIVPRTPKTVLTDADFTNLDQAWHSDGFNYLRAFVTIKLYRLEEPLFQQGRKEVYEKVNEKMSDILLSFDPNHTALRNRFIEDLVKLTLPSAPFALSARCALEAYTPPANAKTTVKRKLTEITQLILTKVKDTVASKAITWGNPNP